MKKFFITLAAVMMLAVSIQAQPPDTLWTQTYGGVDYDFSHDLKITSEGGYIHTGGTHSFGAGGEDVYLVKSNSDGTQEWYQAYGGTGNEYGNCVQQTTDGGYIIAAYTTSYGAGGHDAWIIKTNSLGNLSWSYPYGGTSDEHTEWIEQTNDGGYIFVGYTQSWGAGGLDVYLVKINSSGIQQWYRTYGGAGEDYGECVRQLLDGSFIIVGRTSSFGNGGDIYLIKTDPNGNLIWFTNFGGNEGEYVQYCIIKNNGNIIIAGNTLSYGNGSSDVYLIETDPSGNIIWDETYGGTAWDEGISVNFTFDGGYIISGYTESFGAGAADLYLVKTNSLGTLEWSQTYGGSLWEQGSNAFQTSDGGYIIGGQTFTYGAGSGDIWQIRLEGSPITITLTPHTTPIVIPASGGTVEFDIGVTNNTPDPQTIDVWTEVILTEVGSFQDILYLDFLLPGGAAPSRERSLEVPAIAPAGEYLYCAYVGEYPWIVWDDDSFIFTKEGTDGDWLAALPYWNSAGESFKDVTYSTAPSDYMLHSAYPNPFNPSTVISFELKDAGEVSLIVYDIQGREVQSLVTGHLSLGYHEAVFDGTDLSSGMYFVRLTVDSGQSMVRKVVLMK